MEIQVFPFVPIASCPVTSHHWGQSITLISTLPLRSLYSCLRPTQASSSAGSTVPAPSASLYVTDDPVPSSPWWPCTDLSPVTPCLSWTGKPSTEYPRWVSPVLSRVERSSPLKLLATLLPMTPKIVSALFTTQAHFWLCSHPHARILLCRATFHLFSPTTHLGLLLHSARALYFLFLTTQDLPQPNSPACPHHFGC